MEIRRFDPNDAPQASEIIKNCFLQQHLGNFSSSIIQNQIADNSPDKLIEYSKDTSYFVAVENNKVIGIGGFNKTKVRTLFVNISFQKQGVGHLLLSTILKKARKAGIMKLYSWSTFFAEDFYKKHGFRTIKDLKLPYHNETLIFKEMEINL